MLIVSNYIFFSVKHVMNLLRAFRYPLFQLYEAAVKTRPEKFGSAEFVPFNASHGYGHKLIFMAPELPDIIR